MTGNKLVVLDIDNTLLHTWMPMTLPPFIALDDPHRTEEHRRLFATRLLSEYPGAVIWNDAIICPRPFLQEFIQFLVDEPTIDIGVYSTAAPIYLSESLMRVAPDLLSNAKFVWGKAQCIKKEKRRMKDLSLVAQQFNYDLKDIIMLDDLPVVMPEQNRLAITPFRVDIDLELAIKDGQLKWASLKIFDWFYGEL